MGAILPLDFSVSAACSARRLVSWSARGALGDGRRGRRLESRSSRHAGSPSAEKFGVGTNTFVDLFVEHGFQLTLLFLVDEERFVGSFHQPAPGRTQRRGTDRRQNCPSY